jgi:4-carboxymuconolactone decarboxylase
MTDDAPTLDALPTDRLPRGEAMWQRVMGTAPPTLADDYGAMTRDHVFGEIWSRPGLDTRSRRIISLVCAAMVGADVALQSHLAAALRTDDLSVEELREICIHLAHYGGWPVSATFTMALRAAQTALEAGS